MKNLAAKFIYWYLRVLAKIQLKKHRNYIIGITGTAGKSTTVLAAYSILKSKYNVLCSYQKGVGLNSRTGIPFTLLGILPTGYSVFHWLKYLLLAFIKIFTNWKKYDYIILEYGIDVKNEMDDLLKIAVPRIGAWISTGATHIANFNEKDIDLEKAIQTIAHEEGKLIRALDGEKTAIFRLDDMHMKKELEEWMLESTCKKIILSDIKVQSEITNGELKFSFTYDDKNYNVSINKYALTLDHPTSLLCAIMIAKKTGIKISESIEILQEDLELPKGRNTIIPGKHNSLIIDSSYNSSPEALKSSLELLLSYKSRPKVMILGDMRELGDAAAEAHREIARIIIDKFPKDSLIATVGPLMNQYVVNELKNNDFLMVESFDKAGEAGRFVLKHLNSLKYSSAIILVKGSQNTIFTEIAVEILMQNSKDANEFLTRRGTLWNKKRQKYY